VITIVDYDAGNLASVQKAFRYFGKEVQVTSDPEEVAGASTLVLPGVGNFRATGTLDSSGLTSAVRGAIQNGARFLGICLGMQWLFEGSEESPGQPGLGIFPGRCARFPGSVKCPHVGWNTVRQETPSRLLAGLPSDFFVYYTHSYRALPVSGVVATTEYAGPFAAVVELDHLYGIQFHPEKSGPAGLRILENFLSC
jgi:imidazole glycerol-phosphate synthase subunit HisH